MPNHGDCRLCTVCGQLAEYSVLLGKWLHYYMPFDLHEPVVDDSPMVVEDE